MVALADLFEDRLTACQGQLSKLGIEIPQARCFTGFEACQQLLTVPEVNYVILATPPHFRPMHLKAAIEAGKHVFLEKPAAVDVPGVKLVIEAGELARQKNLGIAAGTQRRHMRSYQETIKRIREGAIGEIVYAKCYWNGGQIWVVDRQDGWSDLEWQLRNWNYFTWLSGDHIVEQHVHNLDVMNWVLGSHPVRAVSGLGGRQVRTGDRHGHIFDHFAVEFEYPGGVTMFSQSRQINGCLNLVGETVVGTAGTSNCHDTIEPKKGRQVAVPRQGQQPLPAGARGPDRQHPRRPTAQRGPGRRGKHHDRHPRPRSRVQRPGDRLGGGHAVHHAAGSGEVRTRPLPHSAGGHARNLPLRLTRRFGRRVVDSHASSRDDVVGRLTSGGDDGLRVG